MIIAVFLGHRIEETSEVPLVISDKVQELKKTKEAVSLLKSVKAWTDIQKVSFIYTCNEGFTVCWTKVNYGWNIN